MSAWFWYAVVAAILYGAHQIFTRLAAQRIGDGLGGFIVEASAALSILIYLALLPAFVFSRSPAMAEAARNRFRDRRIVLTSALVSERKRRFHFRFSDLLLWCTG